MSSLVSDDKKVVLLNDLTATALSLDRLGSDDFAILNQGTPEPNATLTVFNWNGRKVSPEVRNHWIKVYPETSAPAPTEQDEKP
jgi:hypothetical protein